MLDKFCPTSLLNSVKLIDDKLVDKLTVAGTAILFKSGLVVVC